MPAALGNRLSRRRFSGIFRSKKLMSFLRPMVLECKLKLSGRSLFDEELGFRCPGRLRDSFYWNPRASLKSSRKSIGPNYGKKRGCQTFPIHAMVRLLKILDVNLDRI